jgi:hypothetical protein
MCADGSRGEKLALVRAFTKPLRHRVYKLLKQQTSTSCLRAFTKLEISKHGMGAQSVCLFCESLPWSYLVFSFQAAIISELETIFRVLNDTKDVKSPPQLSS